MKAMQCLLLLLLLVGTVVAREEPPDPKNPEPLLPEMTSETDQPDNPTTVQADKRLVNRAFRSCKSNEILTENKGCVNRKKFMQGILLKTWNDVSMEAAKAEAGLNRTNTCKEDEVQTAAGCAPKPAPVRNNESPRVPLTPNYLIGNRVYKNKFDIPETDVKLNPYHVVDSDDAPEQPPPGSDFKPSFRDIVEVAGNGIGNGEDPETAQETTPGGIQKVIGHNRPRKYAFLPGRLLMTYRKCRPYEVLASGKRCVRKRGKVGFYKHKSHKYGSQKRHRHDSIYKKRRN